MFFLAALLCTVLFPAYGARNSDDEARLQKLRGRIEALQEKMNETRGRRDTVTDEMRSLERRIGSLLNDLKLTDARLRQNEKKLENLKSRATREAGNLAVQQRQLERQLYMAFTAGRQDYSKMLLSQDNPASVARVFTYYRYLNRERSERIAAIGDTLSQLDVIKTQIHNQNRELEILRNTQREQKSALETSHARRNELLASLNRQVRDQAQEIARLRADEKRMEQLVEELKIVLPDTPLPSTTERHFSQLRGRLPLPTRGRVLARYGTQKNIGNLKWRGLFIAGREGQQVISVFHGRVVYADWLRGFGLLLILEHGDGYMTLYGHNQSLHKAVGDWVKAGEVIASLGNTGDVAQPGLYFEIRHNGEPRDPLIWCRAR
ncbi:MAG: peptidoglycan DD-metalloendopeptidase family protein [Sulfuricaulis sp.]|uniref:murein hydrolase activator EnvC n=1 Tax=Sulfuricaulis sp. TaxID=2003553 RepID=UPI0034A394B4